jgi:ribonuclease J
MLKIMNPNYIIPIHGEFKMLTELKRNGQNIGIPSDHILQVQNGQKVSLLNHEATITDQQIEIYNVFVDSGKINKDSSGVLRFRQTLSSEGVIGITILINKVTRRLQMLPIFSIRGSFYAQTSNQMLTKIGYDIKEQLEKEMDKRKVLLDNKEIRKIVENITDFYI